MGVKLVNLDAKMYSRIRGFAVRMDPNDQTTWDFPVEEIDGIHRYFSNLIVVFVVHGRRMNFGENPPLSVALVFLVLTLNPINWSALQKAFDPMTINTWLCEREGQDQWRACSVMDALLLPATASTPSTTRRYGSSSPRRRTRPERPKFDSG